MSDDLDLTEEEIKKYEKEFLEDEADVVEDSKDSSEDIDNSDISEDLSEDTNEQNIDDLQEPEEVNYKEFYEKVTAPFKASGEELQATSPEDITRLMQKGVDYTKKTQELSKYNKTIALLSKHNLLDEDKLSYAIDLLNNNASAVKKLYKDTLAANNLDEFDIEESPEYTPSPTSKMTDEEAKVYMKIQELGQDQNNIPMFNQMSSWDKESQQILYNNPEIIDEFARQRASGAFDAVNNHMKQMEYLGKIDPNTPYIHKYKIAGDDLLQKYQVNTSNTTTSFNNNTNTNNTNNNNNSKARAASVQRRSSGSSNIRSITLEDIMEADSETFEKMYKKFQKGFR